MKFLRLFLAIALMASIVSRAAGCEDTLKAGDVMGEVSPGIVSGKEADAAFIGSMADFSIDLFIKSIADDKNALISPLSVMLALAMTANGADNETLTQMENLLGGEIPLSELNEYLYSYANGLPSGDKSKLSIANSIWFRDNADRLSVNEGFLQKNADYFSAALYKAAFDSQTLSDINNWVKANTDGMIDKILDEIEENHLMYLINAVVFDAEWLSVYYKEDVRAGDFTDISGRAQSAQFMYSTEGSFLEDGMATGFIKPYANGSYSFAALLPNEGVAIGEYIKTLTGEGFLNTINNAQPATVYTSMPKFSYEYSIKMNDALSELGIPDAFDEEKADFRKMAASIDGNIYIGMVQHKTFIAVDELGTKAGAVTMVGMVGSGAPIDIKQVYLDRPFVYAIIDNATNLPIFIGTLMVV